MIDPNVFLEMVAETARRGGRNPEKDLEVVLDAMWRNFDYVGEARMRKVVAMGAGALLTTVSRRSSTARSNDREVTCCTSGVIADFIKGNHHCLDRLADGEFRKLPITAGEKQS